MIVTACVGTKTNAGRVEANKVARIYSEREKNMEGAPSLLKRAFCSSLNEL